MAATPKVLREVEEVIAAILGAKGLTRVPGAGSAFMQFELEGSARLCLGLPDLRRGGQLLLRPTVGVLHVDVNGLLKACGGAGGKWTPAPTLIRTLGSLLGDQLRTWTLSETDARAIATDVGGAGLTWARERQTLQDSLFHLTQVERVDMPIDGRALRVAAILHLLGQRSEAQQHLREHVARRAAEGVATNYLAGFDDFAARLAAA